MTEQIQYEFDFIDELDNDNKDKDIKKVESEIE